MSSQSIVSAIRNNEFSFDAADLLKDIRYSLVEYLPYMILRSAAVSVIRNVIVEKE